MKTANTDAVLYTGRSANAQESPLVRTTRKKKKVNPTFQVGEEFCRQNKVEI